MLLYIYSKTKDLDQVKGLLDKGWPDVKYFRWNSFSRLFYPFILYRTLGKHTIERVYLGYPYNIRAHIANTCNTDTWLLDDGTFTLRLNKDLGEPQSALWKAPSLADRLLRRRVGASYLKRVSFFTNYDISPPQGQSVVQNKFASIKSQIIAQDSGEHVLFIGSPIESLTYPCEKLFLELMKKIQGFYKGREITYALHRLESIHQREAQLGPLGIRVVRFETPLEVAIYEEGVSPYEVASFVSSALGNLHQIYGISARSFILPEESILGDHKEAITKLYNDFEKRKISVIDLDR
ncbi:MAG: hypothetical protein KUG83_10475 [Gammaproteobacteria bacterium]|nr:hypothetical protein [Gammaproteobacteria bacterium]